MATWNNNDREESKPTWLNPSQKINCVRTIKGWEIPLHGTNLGANYDGFKTYTSASITANTPVTELIVAMPNDPSSAGVASSLLAGRDSITGGLTGLANDTPNYRPYFTCPFNGDGPTAPGGWDALGVSFAARSAWQYSSSLDVTGASSYYGVGPYGNSTLHLPGYTGYVKIVANDSNFTQSLTFGIVAASTNITRTSLYTGSDLLSQYNVPTAIYETFFGPTATYNNNIAVLKIDGISGATPNSGPYRVTVRVTDGVGGLTADTTFFLRFGPTG